MSGHAGFGGALFQTLRRFYGTDGIPFTFVSDQFTGATRDNNGNLRPLIPSTFSSLSQAEEENGQSRIYLGIHSAFDKTEARAQARRVADYLFRNAFTPRMEDAAWQASLPAKTDQISKALKKDTRASMASMRPAPLIFS